MNDRLEKKPPAPGRRISIALAIAVHLVLAIFLFYGVHWQSERPEAVEVELVRALPEPSTPAPAPEIKPEPRPEPPPPPPEPKPAPREPEIAVKEPQKPKVTPKREPQKPPAKEVSKDATKPAFDPIGRLLADDEKRLQMQRQAADDERRRGEQAEATTRQAVGKTQAAWHDEIRKKIKGNIIRPPGVAGSPEAVYEVTLLPDGSIIDRKQKKSSGVPAIDSAIERAIDKSSPLPKPSDPAAFQRVLPPLVFRPMED